MISNGNVGENMDNIIKKDEIYKDWMGSMNETLK